MIYHKGLVTIMLLQFLFIFVSNCLEYNSVFASGELRCKAEERDALLRFKQGLIDKHDILSSWGSEDDKKECCKWKGVKCSNGTGHVIGLQLSGVDGKIRSALLELSYLNHLDLSDNDFGYDEIPKFIGSLQRLEYLKLGYSNFSGVVPHQLGKLTNLRTLNLSWNGLVFWNCSWLSHLSLLSILDLSQSYLQDTNLLQYMVKLPSMIELHLSFCHIPTHFYVNSSSTTLSILDLSESDLTSSSLQWLFNISTNLHSIDLSDNHLSAIPDAFGKFTFLEYLHLAGNEITGGIPKSLGNLSHLQTLLLEKNQLSGCNLDIFWQYSRLEILDLSGNQITGLLPASLWQLSKLEVLDLFENQITGLLPASLWQLSKLKTLDLSWNQITGLLPASLWQLSKLQTLDMSWNQITGLLPASLWQLSKLEVLDLSWNQITGLLPASLWQLSKLEVLDLSANQITGSVPDLSALISLKELHLGNNKLKLLPAGLWQLSKLEVLDLSNNQITGSVPDLSALVSLKELHLRNNALKLLPASPWQLSKLKVLDLSWNQITGSMLDLSALVSLKELHLGNNKLKMLPAGLWQLSKLEVLDLSSSQITGSVPDLSALVSLKELDLRNNTLKLLPAGLWQLSKLETLDVSFNSIEGTISDVDLSKLYKLKELYLSFNSLVFNVTADWIPPFQLAVISLARCEMGPHFPMWLQTQTQVSMLDFSSTGISDEVPKWFWNLSKGMRYLNLSHNQISGTTPDFSMNSPVSFELDISFNNFSGHLPLFGPYSWKLQLNNNMFLGSISSICTIAYNDLSLLDLSNNQFSGELPNCWNNTRELVILSLANNKLSGHIPHSLGSQKKLGILHLSGNNFSGELPSTLKNCKNLVMIDVGGNNLTGNIPAWIGTHLTNLTILGLRHNNFHGSIPPEICYLTKIQILDLSRNFISGKIPQCFNNFTYLAYKNTTDLFTSFGYFIYSHPSEYYSYSLVHWKGQETEYRKTLQLLKLIDLSSNRLVGNIPREFSHLRALISLNLSRNYLSGNIISDIGQMEMIESLDLSRNQLSGEIPISLAELHFLAVLDLSDNNLSGKIPSSTQLQSFNASLYAGNGELCGLPLTSCPGDGPNTSIIDYGKRENGDEEDDKFVTHGFVISMVLGFIFGFWGVVGTLVIKNSWRYAYFNFFNKIKDWMYVTATLYVAKFKDISRTNGHS